jgi:hypothetical protein
MRLTMHRCAPESPIWEKRVYHLHVFAGADHECTLIQSDGELAAELLLDIEQGRLARPSLFIATNNAQIPPAGAEGTYHNLLPVGQATNEGPFGVRIFYEVLGKVSDQLGFVPHLTFCGGGYVQAPKKHGLFLLADSRSMEFELRRLALQQDVHCMQPGETLEIAARAAGVSTAKRSAAPWVTLLDAASSETAHGDVPHWFARSIFPSGADFEIVRAKVDAELRRMAPIFLLSDIGRTACSCSEYLDGPTGNHRFAFRFYEGEALRAVAALNINTCRFDWIDIAEEMVPLMIPFGVDVHVSDFIALLVGNIQIWELATARMRQWHVTSDRLVSPVAFLYGYFSEQVRPELAEAMYRGIISRARKSGQRIGQSDAEAEMAEA